MVALVCGFMRSTPDPSLAAFTVQFPFSKGNAATIVKQLPESTEDNRPKTDKEAISLFRDFLAKRPLSRCVGSDGFYLEWGIPSFSDAPPLAEETESEFD